MENSEEQKMNFYDILGVKNTASSKEIEEAFLYKVSNVNLNIEEKLYLADIAHNLLHPDLRAKYDKNITKQSNNIFITNNYNSLPFYNSKSHSSLIIFILFFFIGYISVPILISLFANR